MQLQQLFDRGVFISLWPTAHTEKANKYGRTFWFFVEAWGDACRFINALCDTMNANQLGFHCFRFTNRNSTERAIVEIFWSPKWIYHFQSNNGLIRSPFICQTFLFLTRQTIFTEILNACRVLWCERISIRNTFIHLTRRQHQKMAEWHASMDAEYFQQPKLHTLTECECQRVFIFRRDSNRRRFVFFNKTTPNKSSQNSFL